MGAWLDGKNNQTLQMLYYQPSKPQETGTPAGSIGWQSLMSILSGFQSSEDLNDHVLIAGYFIKVAAFLDQYDGTWGQTTQAVDDGTKYLQGKMGDVVNLIIGDVSEGDRSSNTFPLPAQLRRLGRALVGRRLRQQHVGREPRVVVRGAQLRLGRTRVGRGDRQPVDGQPGRLPCTRPSSRACRPTGSASTTRLIPLVMRPTSFRRSTWARPAAGTQRSLVTKLNGSGGGYVGFIGFQTSNVAGIQMLPLSGSAYYLGQDPSFVNTTYTLAQRGIRPRARFPLGRRRTSRCCCRTWPLAEPGQSLAPMAS